MSRQWQAFVARTLCFSDYEQLYYGICFLDKYDRVQYTQGCFHGDDVAIGNDGDPPTPLDTAQFRKAFEQHTRIAMLDAAGAAASDDGTKRSLGSVDAVTSIRLGAVSFQVVTTSFTSLYAVASGKRYGLVAQRVPFGILVAVCRYPHTVEDIAPIVERCCHTLR